MQLVVLKYGSACTLYQSYDDPAASSVLYDATSNVRYTPPSVSPVFPVSPVSPVFPILRSDCWASKPTAPESCPYPQTAAAQVALFEATADMLQGAFAHGKKQGVQSCVGTETALSKPTGIKPFNGTCAPVTPVLGCYQDATARLFNHTITIKDARVSQEWCATQCAGVGMGYAAVEFAVACFCSLAPPPASAKIDDAKCDMKCAADDSENCGGSFALLAYTFTCDAPVPAPPPPRSTQAYYEGIFTRLSKRVPALDWYWAWTPEAWEWGKMTKEEPAFTAAVDDLAAAMAAKEALGYDVKMATNGWVVGPLPDRTIFDQVLPTTWDAITSIDLNTGHDPVDPAYVNVTRHAKWVIPWMEDDPTLTQPQLWVNRTLQHMEDAAKYVGDGSERERERRGERHGDGERHTGERHTERLSVGRGEPSREVDTG